MTTIDWLGSHLFAVLIEFVVSRAFFAGEVGKVKAFPDFQRRDVPLRKDGALNIGELTSVKPRASEILEVVKVRGFLMSLGENVPE